MNTARLLSIDQDALLRQVYGELCAASNGQPNAEWFARMLASRAADLGAMPERLGLTHRQFAALMSFYFPHVEMGELARGPALDFDRMPEREELRTLLLTYAADTSPERVWAADVIIAGCMGSDHLWQDLGLWSRRDVSEFIAHNFPVLKARNDRDMKWKKFLYKQLCIQEGIYTCRAPSCEVCDDYAKCFAPE